MILRFLEYWKYFVHKLRISQLKKNIGLWEGKHITIQPGFKIGHSEKLYLHDFINIGEDAFLNAHGQIEICSGFVSGPKLTIFSVNHIYENATTLPFDDKLNFKKVFIDKNCWFGGNVFIVPGVSLGEGCIVAGGAVVTKSFPPLSVIGGNPAKLIKSRKPSDYKRQKDYNKYTNFIN